MKYPLTPQKISQIKRNIKSDPSIIPTLLVDIESVFSSLCISQVTYTHQVLVFLCNQHKHISTLDRLLSMYSLSHPTLSFPFLVLLVRILCNDDTDIRTALTPSAKHITGLLDKIRSLRNSSNPKAILAIQWLAYLSVELNMMEESILDECVYWCEGEDKSALKKCLSGDKVHDQSVKRIFKCLYKHYTTDEVKGEVGLKLIRIYVCQSGYDFNMVDKMIAYFGRTSDSKFYETCGLRFKVRDGSYQWISDSLKVNQRILPILQDLNPISAFLISYLSGEKVMESKELEGEGNQVTRVLLRYSLQHAQRSLQPHFQKALTSCTPGESAIPLEQLATISAMYPPSNQLVILQLQSLFITDSLTILKLMELCAISADVELVPVLYNIATAYLRRDLWEMAKDVYMVGCRVGFNDAYFTSPLGPSTISNCDVQIVSKTWKSLYGLALTLNKLDMNDQAQHIIRYFFRIPHNLKEATQTFISMHIQNTVEKYEVLCLEGYVDYEVEGLVQSGKEEESKDVLRRAVEGCDVAVLKSAWLRRLGHFDAALGALTSPSSSIEKEEDLERVYILLDQLKYSQALELVDHILPNISIYTKLTRQMKSNLDVKYLLKSLQYHYLKVLKRNKLQIQQKVLEFIVKVAMIQGDSLLVFKTWVELVYLSIRRGRKSVGIKCLNMAKLYLSHPSNEIIFQVVYCYYLMSIGKVEKCLEVFNTKLNDEKASEGIEPGRLTRLGIQLSLFNSSQPSTLAELTTHYTKSIETKDVLECVECLHLFSRVFKYRGLVKKAKYYLDKAKDICVRFGVDGGWNALYRMDLDWLSNANKSGLEKDMEALRLEDEDEILSLETHLLTTISQPPTAFQLNIEVTESVRHLSIHVRDLLYKSTLLPIKEAFQVLKEVEGMVVYGLDVMLYLQRLVSRLVQVEESVDTVFGYDFPTTPIAVKSTLKGKKAKIAKETLIKVCEKALEYTLKYGHVEDLKEVSGVLSGLLMADFFMNGKGAKDLLVARLVGMFELANTLYLDRLSAPQAALKFEDKSTLKVVMLTISPLTDTLNVTLFTPFKVVFQIPMKRSSIREGGVNGVGLGYEQWMQGLDDIMALSSTQCKAASSSTSESAQECEKDTKERRLKWVLERKELDKELGLWIGNLEAAWLGGFKGLLSDIKVVRDPHFSKVKEKVLSLLATLMTNTSKSNLEISENVIDLIIKLGATPSYEELEDVVYYLLDNYHLMGYVIQYDEIDIEGVRDDLADILTAYYRVNHRFVKLDVVLVTDSRVPWESMPCLKSVNVSRVPSLYALERCLAVDGAVDDDVFYLLNPSLDLTRTQTLFTPLLKPFEGLTAVSPTASTLTTQLNNSKIFIYFGHGGAEQYLSLHEFTSAPPLAFLFGCSSGYMKKSGVFGCHGVINEYLDRGARSIVSCLWDVTDGDLDRFSKSVLENVLTGLGADERAVDDSEGLEVKWDVGMDLTEAVWRARKVCKLRYLVGAALVVYGLPIKVRRKL